MSTQIKVCGDRTQPEQEQYKLKLEGPEEPGVYETVDRVLASTRQAAPNIFGESEDPFVYESRDRVLTRVCQAADITRTARGGMGDGYQFKLGESEDPLIYESADRMLASIREAADITHARWEMEKNGWYNTQPPAEQSDHFWPLSSPQSAGVRDGGRWSKSTISQQAFQGVGERLEQEQQQPISSWTMTTDRGLQRDQRRQDKRKRKLSYYIVHRRENNLYNKLIREIFAEVVELARNEIRFKNGLEKV